MDKVTVLLPKLSEILGLNKYKLTYSQKCDCITLFNHRGKEAMIEQAKKFHEKNKVIKESSDEK